MSINVLELYSGIGGMQFALMESGINHEVVAAADINTTANKIYLHNFPKTKLITKCIESISLKELNKLSADMIVMSPPCQPFCRVGKQRDVTDERTKSFLYLLSVLPRLDKMPSYILVENVKGFDTSESRNRLLTTLVDLQYHVQEFLLSPLQFGIPNSRLRYYLIAKRSPLSLNFATMSEFRTDIPDCVSEYLIHRKFDGQTSNPGGAFWKPAEKPNQTLKCNCITCNKITSFSTPSGLEFQSDLCKTCNPLNEMETRNSHARTCGDTDATDFTSKSGENVIPPNDLNSDSAISTRNQSDTSLQSAESASQSDCSTDPEEEVDNQSEIPLYEKYKDACGTVGSYFEKQPDEYFEQYLIPEKFFKRFWVMDLVQSESKNSCCFTKRYAHHMEGSGSIVEMNTQGTVDLSYYKEKRVYDDTVHEAVRSRKLRFFTPREIANLMCFPQSFSFPVEMSNIQMYRVLGNSLNVHVVAVLLRLLTHGDGLETRT